MSWRSAPVKLGRLSSVASSSWNYYNAMAALRSARPAYAVGSYTISEGSCQNPGDDDNPYQRACDHNGAWLEFDVPPMRFETARGLIFPKDYFEWCKRYIAAARPIKPANDRYAEALWVLDVAMRLREMLDALGINYRVFDEYGVATPPLQVLWSSMSGRRTQNAGLWELYAASVGGVFADQSKTAAVVGVGSFIHYDPKFSAGIFDIPASAARHVPRMGKIIDAERALDINRLRDMPWVVGSQANLGPQLLAWQAAFNQGDLPRAQGIENAARLGLSFDGFLLWAQQTANYSLQIDTYGQMRFVPSFAWEYPFFNYLLDAAAGPGFGYESTITTYLGGWTAENVPQLDGAGALRTDVDQPVTMTDYKDLWEGSITAVQERAKLAAQADAATGGISVKVAGKTYTYRQALAAASGGLSEQLYSVYEKALKVLPASWFAVGAISLPLYAISNPFLRSFRDPLFRTVADGSTADFWLRLSIALGNLQFATAIDLGFYAPPWTKDVADAVRAGATALPSTASQAPAPAPPPAPPPVSEDPTAQFCTSLYFQWAAADPRSRCLGLADIMALVQLCHDRVAGAIDDAGLLATSNQIVDAACARAQVGTESSLWSALREGFRSSANPFRLLPRRS